MTEMGIDMKGDTQQLPEDVLGPGCGHGALWGYGVAIFFLLHMTLVLAAGLEAPPVVVAVCMLVAVVIASRLVNVILKRRLRWRIFREGDEVEALVVNREVRIYNGQWIAVQPNYSLTLRYHFRNTEHVSTMPVTDGVYLRHRTGKTMLIRLLPERPTLWIPSSRTH
ncbi:hypothetical protein [Humisphaera borealis]|uniref:Uncharacterized protein n=1 Tax=Humisphaera borealis TaxID=2807512 RepID=A0A7M2WUN9_9BACT|nr:hypothetical protein [Humisphaera borealis]QOV88892.1 hypothetical protein IPV69_22105 [Humisphaera borealis]